MGRYSYSNRMTTKDCKQISASLFNKHHFFDGSVRSGVTSWGRDEEKAERITLVVSTIEGQEFIRFQYNERIYLPRIVSTPCNYGGHRWWFICPFVVNNRVCNRKVNILYFGNGNSFGFRHCLDLTYETSKESNKFDKMFLNMGLDMKEFRTILSKDGFLRGMYTIIKKEEDCLRWEARSLTKLLKPRKTKNENKKIFKAKRD